MTLLGQFQDTNYVAIKPMEKKENYILWQLKTADTYFIRNYGQKHYRVNVRIYSSWQKKRTSIQGKMRSQHTQRGDKPGWLIPCC
jgi:formylmethanofuran dehydrogenase subunit A